MMPEEMLSASSYCSEHEYNAERISRERPRPRRRGNEVVTLSTNNRVKIQKTKGNVGSFYCRRHPNQRRQ
jgi:hypothetical protein